MSIVKQGTVIHVVPAVSEEASGPSYSVVRLCESLRSLGEDVTMVSLDWTPMQAPPGFLKRFPLGLGPRRLGRSPALHRWLDERASAGDVALIHGHGLWLMVNVYPGWVARKHKVPLVFSPRGTLSGWAMSSGSPVKRLFWPLLQRPALTATTCFHATAESEYEDIRKVGFRQPVAIVPNGVDIPQGKSKSPRDSRTLLFLGRIHQKKGLDMLLPAWAAVQDRFPEWNLKIVGPDDGGYLPRMRQLAEGLGLKRVEFTGALLGEAKWQAYRDAGIFVLPTYSENFGLSVAEALASGIPAIVTRGAPWRGLEERRAGWWVDIGVDALVAVLSDALNRPASELEAMGARGREWMRVDFSWNRIAQMMGETYRWVRDGGTVPPWVRPD